MTAKADPVQMYLNDVFTVTVNLAGLPGVAMPSRDERGWFAIGTAVDRASVGRGRYAEYRLLTGTCVLVL